MLFLYALSVLAENPALLFCETIIEPIIKGLNPRATKLSLQLAVKDTANPHKKHAKFEAIMDCNVEARDFT